MIVAHPQDAARAGMLRPFPKEYSYCTPGTYWVQSDNRSVTWRPDRIRLVGPGTMPCVAPIRAADETILLPVYTREDKETPMESVLYRFDDGGHTWSTPIVLAVDRDERMGYCQPCVVELDAGHLRVMHRVETERGGSDRCFWTNESLDGGGTWKEPENRGILNGSGPLLLRDGRVLLTSDRRFEPIKTHPRLIG